MADQGMALLESPTFIRQLNGGDRDAVTLLVRECSGYLLDFLGKKRRQHGLPEADWPDVLQEVFGRFIFNPPDLDPTRSILPYLKRMGLNMARDMAKAARYRRKYEAEAAAANSRLAVGAESIARHLQATEDRAILETKLSRMTAHDQRALRAFVDEGPTRQVAALAERESITPGAAQMRFSRAKERWSKLVGEESDCPKGEL